MTDAPEPGAAVTPLRRGDVRVRGGLIRNKTVIEVWDGAEWIRLRGVIGASWVLDPDQQLPSLLLKFCGRTVELLTPKERIAVMIVREREGGEG